jgi:hypothetical protein
MSLRKYLNSWHSSKIPSVSQSTAEQRPSPAWQIEGVRVPEAGEVVITKAIDPLNPIGNRSWSLADRRGDASQSASLYLLKAASELWEEWGMTSQSDSRALRSARGDLLVPNDGCEGRISLTVDGIG